MRSKFEQTRDSTLLTNNTSWVSIKKKNIKQLMIENFVITTKRKYGLSTVQAKKILSYIIIGLIFKTIDNNDIDFQEGKIISISGFEFEKNTFTIPKNLFEFENSAAQPANSKKKMSDVWEKYLVNFKKNRSFK